MTNRMERVGIAIAAAFTVLGLALTPLMAQNASSTTSDKKPNVVFILADHVGYGDLGCYGGGKLRGTPTPRASTRWPARAAAHAILVEPGMHTITRSPDDRTILDSQRPVADCRAR